MIRSILPLVLISTLAVAGCSRSTAHPPNRPEPVRAAVYKAGRGVQLSPLAAAAIELQSTEVANRDVAGAKSVAAVPASALLRTVKGDFVYVANGDWFLRTAVTVGVTDGPWREIREGLYEGDRIVTQGTRAIWLAELQAVNGGVGCADDN